MKTLNDLFLCEVADMYDAEKRIVKALPKMAKAASSDDLKKALEAHLEETKGHVTKLEEVFAAFGQKSRGKTCQATVGLLEEGGEILADFKGSPAINAAIICAAQKVEHYEMASYGCLRAWAQLLGNTKAAGLLEEILGQEKAANETLINLALAKSNQEALGQAQETADEPTEKKTGVPRRGMRPVANVSGRDGLLKA